MLDVIPDPANSKWVKEFLQEKGKVDYDLQLSTSTVSEEEEEPILVDIQELPKQPPLTRFKFTDSDLPSPLYPVTTYIKSLSQYTDSSDHTSSSLDTDENVKYISSHGTAALFDGDSDDIPCFFPSHSVFSGPLDFEAKLTLDAVRINGDFFIQCEWGPWVSSVSHELGPEGRGYTQNSQLVTGLTDSSSAYIY